MGGLAVISGSIVGLQPAEILRLEDRSVALAMFVELHNHAIAENIDLKNLLRDAAYLLERADSRWGWESRLLAARIRGQVGASS